MKKKIAVLLPARNEERVIRKTIKSLLKVVNPEDIYVISDGSSDRTVEISLDSLREEIYDYRNNRKSGIAKIITPQVLNLKKNRGKAGALNLAIKKYKLAQEYQYLMFIDADTLVTAFYLEKILPLFEADSKKEIACVVGKVQAQQHGWLAAYRIWEYEISQAIHKKAQSITNTVIVCPGCATVCRAELLNQVEIPIGTLTEDMDLTFLIHRKKLGKIVFTDQARVTTQDPRNLKDFVKQIDRWFTGFWQCVLKHHIPWGGQRLDLEVGFLALEGIFNGLLALSIILSLHFLLFQKSSLLALVFIFDLLFLMLPTLIFAGVRNRNFKLLVYFPLFYPVRFLSSLVFLRSFIKVALKLDMQMKWVQAKRYSFFKGGIWPNQFPRLTASP